MVTLIMSTKIDSSTKDCNVEIVNSQYSCNLTSQVSTQFLCPTKLIIIVLYKKNWIKWSGAYFLDKINTHLTNIRWVGYFTIYLQNKE